MNTPFRIALFICLALALAGCGRAASYRYKLTLTLDTPDGVKTGFNVVEVNYFEVRFPASGTPHKVSGQGIYIDLGPGRRPLIALLTSADWRNRPRQDIGWAEDAPTFVFSRACLDSNKVFDMIAEVRSIANNCKEPFEISTSDLPDLVTFSDVGEPKSVMKVDPNDLATTFGPGISWRSMTLQVTNESLTVGIATKLPWLKNMNSYLSGSNIRIGNTLPEILTTADFSRGDR